MRSLFFKIFLWFWLASVLIIVSTLVLLSLLEPYRPVREDGRQVRRLARIGIRAVDILDREGSEALQRFLSDRERRPGTHFFLFDEEITAVTGQPVPREARELASRAQLSGVTEFVRMDRSLMLARPIYGSAGRTYIIVGEIPRRPRDAPVWRLLNTRFLSLRLLAIFIVASIFCYWLAWYLTSPAKKLRTATRQFASGDLTTRVGQKIGRRRDELADLARDFDLMAERIESLISSQSRLLRDVSHELRSPLARLNVALELARQRSGEDAAEALDRIARESERLNDLIAQLLTLTLMESGSEKITKTSLNLSTTVERISEDAEFEARSRNRSVKADLSSDIVIDGSEELVRRAIENVVRNAVRYTAEGTAVEISLKRKQLNGKEYAVLRVRDHGPGVPEEQLTRLFDPFYRVAESRDRHSGGMGIGLTITDRAVRMHGGTARAFNDLDGGLTVEVELPVK
jgi:two-component system sensor histidine kinase CpxA